MPKLIQPASPTSVVLRLKLMDSTSTSGAGLVGLTSGSTGLAIHTLRLDESVPVSYLVTSAAIKDIASLGTYVAPTSGCCRFKEVNASLLPGVYELQLADSRFTANGLIVSINGATRLAQGDFEIQCQNIASDVKTWLGSAVPALVGGKIDANVATISAGVRVVLSAGQPDYAPALQSYVLASVATITGNQSVIISKEDSISGNQATIITKVDNLSAGNATIITKVDGISSTQTLQALQATLVAGIANLSGSNAIIISKEDTISGNQAIIITKVDNISASQATILTKVMGISGDVWNTILTSGGFPNNSAGERLFRAGKTVILEGTLPAQAGISANAVKLPATASSTNGVYDPSTIMITNGTGISQSRTIYQYDGTNQIAWLDRDWKVQPDNTSEFQIVHNVGREEVNEGLVTSAGALTVRLNVNAQSVDNYYMRQLIFIRSGLGQDQVRTILSYNGATQTCTLSEPWGTIPNSGSCYVMLPNRVFSDVIIEGMVGAGSTASTVSATGGAGMVGLVNTSDFYKGTVIKLIAGTGAGQTRMVTAYANATGVFTIAPNWAVTPDATTWFRVVHQGGADVELWRTAVPNALVSSRMDSSVGAVANNAIAAAGIADGAIDRATFAADTGLQTTRSGTAVSATANTIALDSGAKAVDNYYTGQYVLITNGTLGVGQIKYITEYVGSTKVATLDSNWAETPTGTITFAIIPVAGFGPGNWAVATRALTDKSNFGISGLDSSVRVMLSATQPDYIPALQSTLVAAVASITGNQVVIISKEDSISGNQATIITKVNNISAVQANQALQTTLLTGVATITGNQATIISKEDSISATQALQAVETSATANKNSILSSVSTISGNVNTILTSAHGSGAWDAVAVIGEVVLSASQPNYPIAKETTLVTGIAVITGDTNTLKSNAVTIIGKEDAISATQVTIISKADNISADTNTIKNTQTTIVSKEDAISATQALLATEANATINKNSILSNVSTISGNVNTILTSAHGAGAWDAISVIGEVVLSASQPKYPIAKETTLSTIISKEDSISASIHGLGSPMQTGTKVVLSATQSDYAPAKAGDKMDIVNVPNDTAITAMADNIWKTLLQYKDTNGSLNQEKAWVMLQGIFSVLKDKMTTL